jgi:flagellar biosynthesis/type III secretory pathway M-ring protein FliF/YscJ
MGPARPLLAARAPAVVEEAESLPGKDKEKAVTHEVQVAQARALVGQDPKRVAQVVRGWVAQDE